MANSNERARAGGRFVYDPDWLAQAESKDRGVAWTLSPLYDMLSTLAHDGLQPLALTLNGKGDELTRANFVTLAETFGVRREPVLRQMDAMPEGALPWLDRLGEIGLDPTLTERLEGALRERHAALRG